MSIRILQRIRARLVQTLDALEVEFGSPIYEVIKKNMMFF